MVKYSSETESEWFVTRTGEDDKNEGELTSQRRENVAIDFQKGLC